MTIMVIKENVICYRITKALSPCVSIYGRILIIEQIMKQLNKVIEVLRVVDLTEEEHVERETALIKIAAKPEHRDEAMRITEIFRAKIIDSTPTTYTIEISGGAEKIRAIIDLLKPLGIRDFIRTGRIAIARESIKVPV